MTGVASGTAQAKANQRLWATDRVRPYAHRVLRPVEVILLVRYRDQLSRRVLELGCGAGRILGYLVELGGEVHGIDSSPRMVAHTAARYPTATVVVGDMGELPARYPEPFDAILAPDNVLDVLEPAARERVLRDIAGLLTDDGMLIFSSHNLAARPVAAESPRSIRSLLTRLARLSVASVIREVQRMPVRAANRRRLRPAEQHTPAYSILNDEEGDYGALHYYVTREAQARQLAASSLMLAECLNDDGQLVTSGSDPGSPWLHYVARPARGQMDNQNRSRTGAVLEAAG